jgi:hypothetical protein
MLIPIRQRVMQSVAQFVYRLKASSFECQRTKLFPSRLNQIQPADITWAGTKSECQTGWPEPTSFHGWCEYSNCPQSKANGQMETPA